MADHRPGGVALVAHPGPGLPGSESMMLESVAGLVERGWHVVLAVPGDGPLVSEARALGVEVEHIDTLVLRRRLLRPAGVAALAPRTVAGILRAIGALKRSRPDVVYIATIRTPLWAVAARLLRVPIVTHVHDGEQNVPVLVRRGLTASVGLSTRVLVDSEHGRTALLDVAPALASRAVVVGSVAAGRHRSTPPRERITGAFRIVQAGTISPSAGADVALEAVAALRSQGIDVRLTIAGDVAPDSAVFVESLRRHSIVLGVQDRVAVAEIPPGDLPALAGADMVIVPARVGPCVPAAVEAMLAARPVAVSALDGLIEAVEGFPSAIPVAPGDSQALAHAILRVMSSWQAFRTTAIAMSPITAARYAPSRFHETVDAELRRVTSC